MNPDRIVAASLSGRTVHVRDAKTGQTLGMFDGGSGVVTATGNGNLVVLTYRKGGIKVHDAQGRFISANGDCR